MVCVLRRQCLDRHNIPTVNATVNFYMCYYLNMPTTGPRTSYADTLRDRIFDPARPEDRKSLRQIGRELNYSYEHVRKVLRGDPVGSKEFNDRLCDHLGLDADEMWQLAQREKATHRFGSDAVAHAVQTTAGGITPQLAALDPAAKHRMLTVIDHWSRLRADDQQRVVDIVTTWATPRRRRADK